jgi:hypothetical protein
MPFVNQTWLGNLELNRLRIIYIYIGEIIEHNGVDVEANHVLLPEGNKGLLTNNNHVYTGES